MPGHQSLKCPVRYDRKGLNCSLCQLVGHTEKQCTLSWRKFLNITDPSQFEQAKKQKVVSGDTVTFNERISCYNCGMTGNHFAFVNITLFICYYIFKYHIVVFIFHRNVFRKQWLIFGFKFHHQ